MRVVYTSVEPSAASAGDTRTRITRKKQRSFFIYLSPPKTVYQKAEAESNTKRCNEPPLAGAERGGERVEEKLEELEETVDAMRKELIRLRWKAEALETAVAVLAGLAGAFLVTAVRLLLR